MRGASHKPSPITPSNNEKYVSTTVALKDWFMSPQHLATIQPCKVQGRAMRGVGRFPVLYKASDLDQLAVQVHGSVGLARKREARKWHEARKLKQNKKPAVSRKQLQFQEEEQQGRKKVRKGTPK
jgi:hypothetical protein